MSYTLKDLYSTEFYDEFCEIALVVLPGFKKTIFLQAIFDMDWKNRELKDRINHTADVLQQFLPDHFPDAATKLVNIVEVLEEKRMEGKELQYMFLPAYIEKYGLERFAPSIRALERITQYCSCEFAVRPFYIKYPDRMIEQTKKWARHPNQN